MACPICLDELNLESEILRMPICGHKVHTVCALSAAQYDIRCPICRSQHPDCVSIRDRENNILTQYQGLTDLQDVIQRRYRRRRNLAVRNSPKLQKIRERIKRIKQEYIQTDHDLDREWMRFQKYAWKNDPMITECREARRKQQRRFSDLNRTLERKLEDRIGHPPVDFMSIFELDSSNETD